MSVSSLGKIKEEEKTRINAPASERAIKITNILPNEKRGAKGIPSITALRMGIGNRSGDELPTRIRYEIPRTMIERKQCRRRALNLNSQHEKRRTTA